MRKFIYALLVALLLSPSAYPCKEFQLIKQMIRIRPYSRPAYKPAPVPQKEPESLPARPLEPPKALPTPPPVAEPTPTGSRNSDWCACPRHGGTGIHPPECVVKGRFEAPYNPTTPLYEPIKVRKCSDPLPVPVVLQVPR